METMHKPDTLARELTKTEIDIAVAQIVDRLMRYATCAHEIYLEQEGGEISLDYQDHESYKMFCNSHGIPVGVHPLWDEAIEVCEVSIMAKYVKKWVSGKLDSEECAEIYFVADAISEFDLGWVFLDQPSFFYQAGQDAKKAQMDNVESFFRVGTRKSPGSKSRALSHKKHGRGIASKFLHATETT
jgi:hypothetical protein